MTCFCFSQPQRQLCGMEECWQPPAETQQSDKVWVCCGVFVLVFVSDFGGRF